MTKLKLIADTDYHKLWLSSEVIDSDKPVYLIAKLEYTDSWGDSPAYKYHGSVIALGPQWPTPNTLQHWLDTLDMKLEEFRHCPLLGQLEILTEVGLCATLFQRNGNNQYNLRKLMKNEIDIMSMMFGFYMDKPQNAIGDTGWNWIAGEIATHVGKD